jgi:hypothetical protein
MRRYVIAAAIALTLATAAHAKVTLVSLAPTVPQTRPVWFIRATISPDESSLWTTNGRLIGFAAEEVCKSFVRNDPDLKVARDGLPPGADVSCVTE